MMLKSLCVVAALLPSLSMAQSDQTTERSLIVETVYRVRETVLGKPIQIVRPIARSDADYSTPEAATVAYFSAMKAKDFAWSNATWTTSALQKLLKDDAASGRDRNYWLDRWQREYVGRTVELYAKVEVGPFVLMAYREAGDQKTGNQVPLVVALRRTAPQTWRVTNELDGDPLMSFWASKTARVQVVSDVMTRSKIAD